MITFKQKGKFEYQVLFNNKEPLNITLSQNKSTRFSIKLKLRNTQKSGPYPT